MLRVELIARMMLLLKSDEAVTINGACMLSLSDMRRDGSLHRRAG